MPGDLRFQQVDAPTTINGYFNAGPGLSTFLIRGAQYFGDSIGTPLPMGPGSCDVAPSTDGVGCAWPFAVAPLPASLAGASGFIVGYASDLYDNFQGDMANPSFMGFTNNITPISSSSVITSLDLEPANILFGLSWVQSDQQTGFNLTVQTVALAGLQAAATQDGTNSRVITAVSNNSGQLTYISYGWQADTSTVYEAQVATASPADAPAAAATLASQGYIITAVGMADSNEDIVLVGTRVQGDTMARPFMTAQQPPDVTTMQGQGYATVGVIVQPVTYATTYLGER